MHGSTRVAGKTEAETKADKLNRAAQSKLEDYITSVQRDRIIQQRQFRHTETLFRLKANRLATRRPRSDGAVTGGRPECPQPPTEGGTKLPPIRPKSSPSTTVHSSTTKSPDCSTCRHIQDAVRLYEHEGRRTGAVGPTSGHITCIFSDAQVHAFLQMLESNLQNSKLMENGSIMYVRPNGSQKIQLPNNSNLDNPELLDDSVVARIRRFCVEADRFIKDTDAIPEEVKLSLDRVRLSLAVDPRRTELPPPGLVTVRERVLALLQL